MDAVIREYCDDDLAAMSALMEELGYPTTAAQMQARMAQIGANSLCAAFVATVDGEVVGMVGARLLRNYEVDVPVAQIAALVVSRERRGTGVGKALLAHIERWAVSHGARSLR